MRDRVLFFSLIVPILAGLAGAACGPEVRFASSSGGPGGAQGGSGHGGATTGTGTGGHAGGNDGGMDAAGGDGGQQCPALGDPCTTCLAAGCAGTYCACYTNLACGALSQCLDGCGTGDAQCIQGCLTSHPDGISTLNLLGGCAATTCPTICPGAALNPCQQCLYTKCEVEMNKCIADPECTAILTCNETCGSDAGCTQQCVDDDPSGASDVEFVAHCSQILCVGTCP